jgi:uncharacterized membrane protein
MFDSSIWSKLHGASTHFPIALMFVSVLCEGFSYFCKNHGVRQSYRFVATVAIVLGALGSYAAVITGLVFTRGQMWGHATMLRHHQFVWPAFALMTGLAAWRVFARSEPPSKSATLHLVLMVLTAALMGGAGFFGGELFHEG